MTSLLQPLVIVQTGDLRLREGRLLHPTAKVLETELKSFPSPMMPSGSLLEVDYILLLSPKRKGSAPTRLCVPPGGLKW